MCTNYFPEFLENSKALWIHRQELLQNVQGDQNAGMVDSVYICSAPYFCLVSAYYGFMLVQVQVIFKQCSTPMVLKVLTEASSS